jgi:hypothetical protein
MRKDARRDARIDVRMATLLDRSTVLAIALAAIAGQSGAAARRAAAVPILVELFTSEGCSTCPPADTLLDKLISMQPVPGVAIVGLGEHVDYWDRLGWRDRFSSASFTTRQQAYGAALKVADVYTPQMVVDGEAAFVGSDVAALQRAIERALARPHGAVDVMLDPSTAGRIAVTVKVTDLPAVGTGDRAEVTIAVAEDGLRSDVTRGENRGRALSHAAVVRYMSTIADNAATGTVCRGDVKLDKEWRTGQLKIVAFVQERRSRRVLATAEARPVHIEAKLPQP